MCPQSALTTWTDRSFYFFVRFIRFKICLIYNISGSEIMYLKSHSYWSISQGNTLFRWCNIFLLQRANHICIVLLIHTVTYITRYPYRQHSTGSFPGVKRPRRGAGPPPLSSVPRYFKKCRATPLSTLRALVAYKGGTFKFTFYRQPTYVQISVQYTTKDSRHSLTEHRETNWNQLT